MTTSNRISAKLSDERSALYDQFWNVQHRLSDVVKSVETQTSQEGTHSVEESEGALTQKKSLQKALDNFREAEKAFESQNESNVLLSLEALKATFAARTCLLDSRNHVTTPDGEEDEERQRSSFNLTKLAKVGLEDFANTLMAYGGFKTFKSITCPSDKIITSMKRIKPLQCRTCNEEQKECDAFDTCKLVEENFDGKIICTGCRDNETVCSLPESFRHRIDGMYRRAIEERIKFETTDGRNYLTRLVLNAVSQLADFVHQPADAPEDGGNALQGKQVVRTRLSYFEHAKSALEEIPSVLDEPSSALSLSLDGLVRTFMAKEHILKALSELDHDRQKAYLHTVKGTNSAIKALQDGLLDDGGLEHSFKSITCGYQRRGGRRLPRCSPCAKAGRSSCGLLDTMGESPCTACNTTKRESGHSEDMPICKVPLSEQLRVVAFYMEGISTRDKRRHDTHARLDAVASGQREVQDV